MKVIGDDMENMFKFDNVCIDDAINSAKKATSYSEGVNANLDILNNLATVETTQTLTLNALSIALLTPEEIAIGVNKNWDVVGA